MKTYNAGSILATALICLVGCSQESDEPSGSDAEIIAEGVIYYLEYEMTDGRTGGFTRLNISTAVPGGNGSWNVDAYGRLTNQYLIITYPQKKDLGPRVIPTHRLVGIQFGDGGIKSTELSLR